MCWVYLAARNIIAFGIDDPSDDAVIDGHSNERAKYLREKDSAGGYVHIMAHFLILKHDLSSIPSVACNRAVHGSADWVLEAGNRVNHQAIKHFIC